MKEKPYTLLPSNPFEPSRSKTKMYQRFICDLYACHSIPSCASILTRLRKTFDFHAITRLECRASTLSLTKGERQAPLPRNIRVQIKPMFGPLVKIQSSWHTVRTSPSVFLFLFFFSKKPEEGCIDFREMVGTCLCVRITYRGPVPV